MLNSVFKKSVLTLGILTALSSFAYADCETDLGLLETAMAAQGVSADQMAAFQKAGEDASSALRKDDDATCHQVVMDALKASGAKVDTAAPATSTAALGDLKPFRDIADDTLKIVQKGDLAAATVRIKDLETAWDVAQPTLKPKNTGAWTTLDDAIDASLKQLRAGAPDAKGSADALSALIAAIDATK